MLVRMVEKKPRQTFKDLKAQRGPVWGHGFNKYHMPHTEPNRTSWANAKEDTTAEEKT